MQQLDIPIIAKTYALYRALQALDRIIPKMQRYSLWQRTHAACLDVLERLLGLGYMAPELRTAELLKLAPSVDLLKVLLRLAFDVKAINHKNYITLQQSLDEIGRMLGGWIKSLKNK